MGFILVAAGIGPICHFTFHHLRMLVFMNFTSFRIATLVSLGLFAVPWISGCGSGDSKPSVKVTGEITYEGKPVTEGEVSFEAQDGAAATVSLDSEGKFEIEQLPVGEYAVSVTPPPITEAPTEANVKIKTYENIPDGYQTISTSDFRAEVDDEGENHFKFDMKKGGPAASGGAPAQMAP